MKLIIYTFLLILITDCTHHTRKDIVWMKFKEVYFDGDIVELDKKDIDRKKNLKILNILYYYGIEFKLDTAGSIYIPQSIYDDRDFRLSVTSKSEDINWINDHVIKDLSDTVSR